MNESPAPHWLSKQRIQKLSWAFLVFFALLSGHFFKTVLFAPNAKHEAVARDFVTFYAASSLALDDRPADAYNLKKIEAAEKAAWPKLQVFPWFYPPTFLLVSYPLAWMDYLTAFTVFTGLTIALFLLAAGSALPRPAIILPTLAFPAVMINLIFGQNGLLTAALALLALYHLDKRPILAGVFIGLLAIKPHLAILFPLALVLGRRWTAFVSASVTTLVFILASVLLLGADTWLAFLANLQEARTWLEQGKVAWPQMISPYIGMRILGVSSTVAYGIQACCAIFFLTAFIRVWHTSRDMLLCGSVFVIATLNISPYLFDYELSWLAIPVLLLTLRGLEQGWLPRERELLAFVWLFPFLDMLMSLLGINQILKINLVIIPELIILMLVMKKLNAPDGRTTDMTAR